jgi:hypothetical protein
MSIAQLFWELKASIIMVELPDIFEYLKVSIIDVEIAFLQGKFTEDMYTSIPEGMH